jgi:hypothetical protein
MARAGHDPGPRPPPADLELVQTGAWVPPDARPIPAEL